MGKTERSQHNPQWFERINAPHTRRDFLKRAGILYIAGQKRPQIEGVTSLDTSTEAELSSAVLEEVPVDGLQHFFADIDNSVQPPFNVIADDQSTLLAQRDRLRLTTPAVRYLRWIVPHEQKSRIENGNLGTTDAGSWLQAQVEGTNQIFSTLGLPIQFEMQQRTPKLTPDHQVQFAGDVLYPQEGNDGMDQLHGSQWRKVWMQTDRTSGGTPIVFPLSPVDDVTHVLGGHGVQLFTDMQRMNTSAGAVNIDMNLVRKCIRETTPLPTLERYSGQLPQLGTSQLRYVTAFRPDFMTDSSIMSLHPLQRSYAQHAQEHMPTWRSQQADGKHRMLVKDPYQSEKQGKLLETTPPDTYISFTNPDGTIIPFDDKNQRNLWYIRDVQANAEVIQRPAAGSWQAKNSVTVPDRVAKENGTTSPLTEYAMVAIEVSPGTVLPLPTRMIEYLSHAARNNPSAAETPPSLQVKFRQTVEQTGALQSMHFDVMDGLPTEGTSGVVATCWLPLTAQYMVWSEQPLPQDTPTNFPSESQTTPELPAKTFRLESPTGLRHAFANFDQRMTDENGIPVNVISDSTDTIRRKRDRYRRNPDGTKDTTNYVRFIFNDSIYNTIKTHCRELGVQNPAEWLHAHIEVLNMIFEKSGVDFSSFALQPEVYLIPGLRKAGWKLLPSEDPDRKQGQQGNWRELATEQKMKDGSIIQDFSTTTPLDDLTVSFASSGNSSPEYPFTSSYNQATFVRSMNKVIQIDYGLIHEMLHVWGHLPDLYKWSGELPLPQGFTTRKIQSFQDDIMGSSLNNIAKLTPASKMIAESLRALNPQFRNVQSEGLATVPVRSGDKIFNLQPLGIYPSTIRVGFFQEVNGQKGPSLKNTVTKSFLINQMGANGQAQEFDPAYADDTNHPDYFTINRDINTMTQTNATSAVDDDNVKYEHRFIPYDQNQLATNPAPAEIAQLPHEDPQGDVLPFRYISYGFNNNAVLPIPDIAFRLSGLTHVKTTTQAGIVGKQPEEAIFDVVFRQSPTVLSNAATLHISIFEGKPIAGVPGIIATSQIPHTDNMYIVWSQVPFPQDMKTDATQKRRSAFLPLISLPQR